MEYDIEREEHGIICVHDGDRIIYTIVQQDADFKNTGVSIVKRILEDRHAFIGTIYSVQSYFHIKYIDDENIKVDKRYSGADRNELTYNELMEILSDDSYRYVYSYDVKDDVLTLKDDILLTKIDFHYREEVEEFLAHH